MQLSSPVQDAWEVSEDIEPPPPEPHPHQTTTNNLGVFRRYLCAPTWHPTEDECKELICEFSTKAPVLHHNNRGVHDINYDPPEPFEPFSNISSAMFMSAYSSGLETKSATHANTLARVIKDELFSIEDFQSFNYETENARMDKYITQGTHPFHTQDGWHEATVNIRLPIEGNPGGSEAKAPLLSIPGLFHRNICDIITDVCQSDTLTSFHLTPYTMHWVPDPNYPDRSERVYSDMYMSDSMIQAQKQVNLLPRTDGDNKEHVVLGIMLASDAAHLTNFGSASVWPIYLMFANQPKRERVKPSHHAVHHLAYVPTVCLYILY